LFYYVIKIKIASHNITQFTREDLCKSFVEGRELRVI